MEMPPLSVMPHTGHIPGLDQRYCGLQHQALEWFTGHITLNTRCRPGKRFVFKVPLVMSVVSGLSAMQPPLPGGASHPKCRGLRVRTMCERGLSRSNPMANDTENRGSTAGNREKQSGSTGSQQQMNRGNQSGSSNMGGTQSSTQQSSPSTQDQWAKNDRTDDKTRKPSGGPGTGTSQYTNAGSTGTGSGQISPHNPASGQSSSSGRSGSGSSGSSSGSERE
jgi:hypothetical protein